MKKHLLVKVTGVMACLLLVFVITTAFGPGKNSGKLSGTAVTAGKALQTRCFTQLPFPEQQKQEVLGDYCKDVYDGAYIIITTCNPGFNQCAWSYCNTWYPECQVFPRTETIR